MDSFKLETTFKGINLASIVNGGTLPVISFIMIHFNFLLFMILIYSKMNHFHLFHIFTYEIRSATRNERNEFILRSIFDKMKK